LLNSKNVCCETTSTRVFKAIVVFYDTSLDSKHNDLLGKDLLGKLQSLPLKLVWTTGRPTFRDLIRHANSKYPGRRILTSNGDIYFDQTLALLDSYDLNGKLLCLSRREMGNTGEMYFGCPSCSQDAWIFETPFPDSPFDIPVGLMGCDERLVWETQKAGLLVSNPCKTISICHRHSSDVYSPGRGDKAPGPWQRLTPSELWPRLRQNGDQSTFLPAFAATIHGGEIRYEADGLNLGYWTDCSDWVSWEFSIEVRADFTCEITYAAPPNSEGNSFELSVESTKVLNTVQSTGSWYNYVTVRLGPIPLLSRVKLLAVKPIEIHGGGLMNLRCIRLRPALSPSAHDLTKNASERDRTNRTESFGRESGLCADLNRPR